MIVRNVANVISLLGVLPVYLLFIDDGYRYLLPLIIFNNVMDDLDGIVAGKLNTRSEFGGALDNICDVVAHTVFVLAVGAHYGWIPTAMAMAAATAMLIRIVSRTLPEATTGIGSPTNELIRHMFFVLLLANIFSFNVAISLAVVFALHTVSMLLPYRMPWLLRSLAKSTLSIGLVNGSLIAAWLVPFVAPVVALAFGSTYLYGFVSGGLEWSRASRSSV